MVNMYQQTQQQTQQQQRFSNAKPPSYTNLHPESIALEEGQLPKDKSAPQIKKGWSLRRKLCCFGCLPLFLAALVVIIVLVVLVVTNPYPSVKNYGTTMDKFGVGSDMKSVGMNMTVYLGVDNTEFVPISLNSLQMDIYYKTTIKVGVATKGKTTFKPNSFTNMSIPVNITVSNATVAIEMMQDYSNHQLKLDIKGPVQVGVFGIHVTRDISFSDTFGGTLPVSSEVLSELAKNSATLEQLVELLGSGDYSQLNTTANYSQYADYINSANGASAANAAKAA